MESSLETYVFVIMTSFKAYLPTPPVEVLPVFYPYPVFDMYNNFLEYEGEDCDCYAILISVRDEE